MGKSKEYVGKYRTKLGNTPFKTAKELSKAKQECLETVWNEMEYAKQRLNLSQDNDFEDLFKLFKKGYKCTIGNDNEDVFRVYFDEDESMKMNISEKLFDKIESKPKEASFLIKSLNEMFLDSYLSVIGLKTSKDNKSDKEIALLKSFLERKDDG